MTTAATPRLTAEERREEILLAAVRRFGETGLYGTSTEAIASDVGVSQPYIFRLYGTKKQLFLEAVRWGFDHTIETFREAGESAPNDHEALRRMGKAYEGLVLDRHYLGIQLQAYAASNDPDVQALVEESFGRLVDEIVRHAHVDPRQLTTFLGRGMLINVVASVGFLESEGSWAEQVRSGCIGGFDDD